MKELSWSQWLEEGAKYERAGKGKGGKDSKLSPVVVYNLLSMSLESYSMAILDYHKDLADNHTFSDLMYCIERHFSLDPVLKAKIEKLEQYQRICSFSDFVVSQADKDVNKEFEEVLVEFGELARRTCLGSTYEMIRAEAC